MVPDGIADIGLGNAEMNGAKLMASGYWAGLRIVGMDGAEWHRR